MAAVLDELDRKILAVIQRDATLSLDDLAKRVASSRTPVWNRMRKLRRAGVIKREVAILDPAAVGMGACFYVLVRTSEHAKDWQQRFLDALHRHPEIQEAHRLAGDVDYLLKVRVEDTADYDRFYQALVADVSLFNVTSLLSMQELISRTELPLDR